LPQLSPDFAPEQPANRPDAVFALAQLRAARRLTARQRRRPSSLEGNMPAGDLLETSRRRTAASLLAFLLTIVLMAPAAAAPPPNAMLNSTDAMLKWISAYRGKPEQDRLPVLVRALSDRQAFKDAETCGAYIGFIAGVIGANPDRAEALIEKMLTMQPADHWVLVRAIAYSGLPNWKVVLVKFADRMPTRSAMIEKYLDGKLPTLDQIADRTAKRGMIDKIKQVLKIEERKKEVAIEPSPELIDVLWGYYLATGSYKPIGRIIKLLPLADDNDSVDNLTTGSAAKFTLASNAVRDRHLLAMLKRAATMKQPEDVAKVLNDVIETAENVDTARMRKDSLAAIEELKQKGPNSKRDITGLGQIGQGALAMGCVVAAATGQIELGIPCVVGGAAYSAGMQYISH
jgi:hypothetical protein